MMAAIAFTPIDLSRHADLCMQFRRDAMICSFVDGAQRFERDDSGCYLDWLKQQIKKWPEGCVHVFKEDSIVGQIEMRQISSSQGYIHLFYLIPELRGQGLGDRLHQYALQTCQQRGLQRVQLACSPTNQRAMAFYQKHGWRDVGVKPGYTDIRLLARPVDDYTQQVIVLYSRRTDYDTEPGTTHPAKAQRLLDSVPLAAGQSILDIATGTGLVAIPAAQRVGPTGRVVAVDLTPAMLDQAREKIAVLKLSNLKLIEANAETIDFAKHQFDAVFCCEALVLFQNVLASLQKWHRWLKPGGYVAFTCPQEDAYLSAIYKHACAGLPDPLTHLLEPLGTAERCRQLLALAGFVDIEVESEASSRSLSPENFSVRNRADAAKLRESLMLSFKGHPQIRALSSEQFTQVQQRYQTAVDALLAEPDSRENTTTFFVRARVPV
ncbi:MAG: GNAT family N-acetyltransferase [Leptolyngbya sp. SIO4C1]|nr:GNAT family N-acetyltransferase [Leptolyngbya sp. SIO4C1]